MDCNLSCCSELAGLQWSASAALPPIAPTLMHFWTMPSVSLALHRMRYVKECSHCFSGQFGNGDHITTGAFLLTWILQVQPAFLSMTQVIAPTRERITSSAALADDIAIGLTNGSICFQSGLPPLSTNPPSNTAAAFFANLVSSEPTATIRNYVVALRGLSFDEHQLLVSVSATGKLQVWDLGRRAKLAELDLTSNNVELVLQGTNNACSCAYSHVSVSDCELRLGELRAGLWGVAVAFVTSAADESECKRLLLVQMRLVTGKGGVIASCDEVRDVRFERSWALSLFDHHIAVGKSMEMTSFQANLVNVCWKGTKLICCWKLALEWAESGNAFSSNILHIITGSDGFDDDSALLNKGSCTSLCLQKFESHLLGLQLTTDACEFIAVLKTALLQLIRLEQSVFSLATMATAWNSISGAPLSSAVCLSEQRIGTTGAASALAEQILNGIQDFVDNSIVVQQYIVSDDEGARIKLFHKCILEFAWKCQESSSRSFDRIAVASGIDSDDNAEVVFTSCHSSLTILPIEVVGVENGLVAKVRRMLLSSDYPLLDNFLSTATQVLAFPGAINALHGEIAVLVRRGFCSLLICEQLDTIGGSLDQLVGEPLSRRCPLLQYVESRRTKSSKALRWHKVLQGVEQSVLDLVSAAVILVGQLEYGIQPLNATTSELEQVYIHLAKMIALQHCGQMFPANDSVLPSGPPLLNLFLDSVQDSDIPVDAQLTTFLIQHRQFDVLRVWEGAHTSLPLDVAFKCFLHRGNRNHLRARAYGSSGSNAMRDLTTINSAHQSCQVAVNAAFDNADSSFHMSDCCFIAKRATTNTNPFDASSECLSDALSALHLSRHLCLTWWSSNSLRQAETIRSNSARQSQRVFRSFGALSVHSLQQQSISGDAELDFGCFMLSAFWRREREDNVALESSKMLISVNYRVAQMALMDSLPNAALPLHCMIAAVQEKSDDSSKTLARDLFNDVMVNVARSGCFHDLCCHSQRLQSLCNECDLPLWDDFQKMALLLNGDANCQDIDLLLALNLFHQHFHRAGEILLTSLKMIQTTGSSSNQRKKSVACLRMVLNMLPDPQAMALKTDFLAWAITTLPAQLATDLHSLSVDEAFVLLDCFGCPAPPSLPRADWCARQMMEKGLWSLVLRFLCCQGHGEVRRIAGKFQQLIEDLDELCIPSVEDSLVNLVRPALRSRGQYTDSGGERFFAALDSFNHALWEFTARVDGNGFVAASALEGLLCSSAHSAFAGEFLRQMCERSTKRPTLMKNLLNVLLRCGKLSEATMLTKSCLAQASDPLDFVCTEMDLLAEALPELERVIAQTLTHSLMQ